MHAGCSHILPVQVTFSDALPSRKIPLHNNRLACPALSTTRSSLSTLSATSDYEAKASSRWFRLARSSIGRSEAISNPEQCSSRGECRSHCEPATQIYREPGMRKVKHAASRLPAHGTSVAISQRNVAKENDRLSRREKHRKRIR